MPRIDLNSDMGESFGAYSLGNDAAVLGSVTSANIACGYHAGDPTVMRRTIQMAAKAGVAVGAHPGFPDLLGFGRRELNATPAEVEDFVLYQIGALAGVAAAEGVRLQHVKAHGALANMAAKNAALAGAIARAVASFDRSLILIALASSELVTAGRQAGLRVASEVYADRAYESDASLASRRKPGSVLRDPDLVVQRAVRMVRERSVVTVDGSTLQLEADTICVHGDTAGAETLTARLRAGLEQAGVRVIAIGAAE